MKVLIAGCGYVGTATGEKLAFAGHEVYGMRRTEAASKPLAQLGIRPLVGDLTNSETLEELPGPFDWVVNCASASGGGPEDYERIYCAGNQNLTRWLLSQREPPRKYVYTSSTGVYGQDDGSVVTESSVTEPPSGTGPVLVRAEQILARAVSDGLPAVTLRVAGIYGPGRGYWLRQYLSGEAVMEGDGSRLLNMVHLDDVAGAIIAALERGAAGRVYNVVDDEPVAQKTVFVWLAQRLGRPMPRQSVSSGADSLRRRRGATNKAVSNDRLKRELGYRFVYPTFREGYERELAAQGIPALRKL